MAGQEPDSLAILLVEDHALIAQMMLQMLHAMGHRSRHADCLAAAAHAIRDHDFDALLCDFSLPDGSALDLARQFHGQLPPTILLTAYGADQVPVETSHRFALTLEKPVDAQQLASALKQIRQG